MNLDIRDTTLSGVAILALSCGSIGVYAAASTHPDSVAAAPASARNTPVTKASPQTSRVRDNSTTAFPDVLKDIHVFEAVMTRRINQLQQEEQQFMSDFGLQDVVELFTASPQELQHRFAHHSPAPATNSAKVAPRNTGGDGFFPGDSLFAFPGWRGWIEGTQMYLPRVVDKGDHLVVTMLMPGMTIADLKINVEPKDIKVDARKHQERKSTSPTAATEAWSRSDSDTQIHREVALNWTVVPLKADSSLKNGILTISVPKAGALHAAIPTRH